MLRADRLGREARRQLVLLCFALSIGGGCARAFDLQNPSIVDTTPAEVTLIVTERSAPAPGIVVYFQNADGSLVARGTTDVSGVAAAKMAPGGNVTLIEPRDDRGRTQLDTFADVAPGDVLHYDRLPLGATEASMPTLSVPQLAGANAYRVFTSCGEVEIGANASATVQLVGCGTMADAIVVALDADANVLGALYNADIAVADPMAIGGTYAPMIKSTFAYTNISAQVQWIKTYRALVTAKGSMFDATAGSPPSGGAATNVLDEPSTSGTMSLTVTDQHPIDTERGEQLVYDWGPSSPSYALDVGTALLPSYASDPAYDAASRTVSWSERSGSIEPDVVRAQLHAAREDADDGVAWTWRLVTARRDGPSVTFPVLPVDAFDWNPRSADVIGIDQLTMLSVPGGYDAIRGNGFADARAFVTGESGRIVVERLYSPAL